MICPTCLLFFIFSGDRCTSRAPSSTDWFLWSCNRPSRLTCNLMRLSNITDATLALTQHDPINFANNPTPVDGSPPARLAEVLGHRKRLCHYDHHWQSAQNMHFMRGHESGTRLLIHITTEWFHLFYLNKNYINQKVKNMIVWIPCMTIINAARKMYLIKTLLRVHVHIGCVIYDKLTQRGYSTTFRLRVREDTISSAYNYSRVNCA